MCGPASRCKPKHSLSEPTLRQLTDKHPKQQDAREGVRRTIQHGAKYSLKHCAWTKFGWYCVCQQDVLSSHAQDLAMKVTPWADAQDCHAGQQQEQVTPAKA